jgi:hypothetical protein
MVGAAALCDSILYADLFDLSDFAVVNELVGAQR